MIAKGRKAPSRLRYEAEHPSLTVRLPTEVKTKITEAAKAEGLSVSEWVQAMAAGHAPDVTAAFDKGRAAGRKEGEAAGDRRGKTDGQAQGAAAGYAAGALWAIALAERGRHPSLQWAASEASADTECRRIVQGLAERHGWGKDLRRLLRRAEHVDASG